MVPDPGHIDRAADASRFGDMAPAPRLLPPETRLTRATPRVTTASLCLPEKLVRKRAMALADRVRAMGATHSLRVWRVAHREALVQLAREASKVAMDVDCQALFWDRDGALYYVTATFAAAQPTLH